MSWFSAVRNDRNKKRKPKQEGCVSSASLEEEISHEEESTIDTLLKAHQDTFPLLENDDRFKLVSSTLCSGWRKISCLNNDRQSWMNSVWLKISCLNNNHQSWMNSAWLKISCLNNNRQSWMNSVWLKISCLNNNRQSWMNSVWLKISCLNNNHQSWMNSVWLKISCLNDDAVLTSQLPAEGHPTYVTPAVPSGGHINLKLR